MKIKAVNLRKDYIYLTIESHFGKYLVSYQSRANLRPSVDIFATLAAAKSFCTKEIQNPKWGANFPKLQWEDVKE